MSVKEEEEDSEGGLSKHTRGAGRGGTGRDGTGRGGRRGRRVSNANERGCRANGLIMAYGGGDGMG